MFRPTISVITVVYNGVNTLEQTFKSVFNQTYPNVEYLVIDGGSKDRTVEIIKAYQTKINYWVSEPDKGLYDAMNKGIVAATGDYLFFLNADDQFYDNEVLEKMISSFDNADVYYGDVMVTDSDNNDVGLRSEVTPHKVPLELTWKSLKHGMVVSHQAFLVKRSITPLYDTQYKISADIDWMIKVLKSAKRIHNTQLIIAKFKTGGSSTQRQKLAWKERYNIFSKHYGSLTNFFNHLYIAVRYLIKKPFSKL
ncbi:glycosyltransferase family 2 protein [Chitinophagaceae bacterium LWZ2-11]